jgi:hypothetical protein
MIAGGEISRAANHTGFSLTNFGGAYEGQNPCLCASDSYSNYHSFRPCAAGEEVPRIGYISSGFRSGHQLEVFRQALRELGYIEGRNILIEDRYLEGKAGGRARRLVDELVKLKVDILLSSD